MTPRYVPGWRRVVSRGFRLEILGQGNGDTALSEAGLWRWVMSPKLETGTRYLFPRSMRGELPIEMNQAKIACLDVYYHAKYARACSIVFQTAPCEKIISKYCAAVKPFQAYVSGEFYKRELPCLLQVYTQIREKIDIIIIDGYVMLGKGKKGLGGYLYEALDKKIPVIGVAKTYFKDCVHYTTVYRGTSARPLYVSSIGLDLDFSAALIRNLQGPYRIPAVLKAVDHLTRRTQGDGPFVSSDND